MDTLREPVVTGDDAENSDLLKDPNAWSSWSPREEISPEYQVDPSGGFNEGIALVISGKGNPLECGCWNLPLTGLVSGHSYEVEALFQTEGIPAPGKSIRAVLTCSKGNGIRVYDHLDEMGKQAGWNRLGIRVDVSESTPPLSLGLFMAWTGSGKVMWGGATLRDVSGQPRPDRTVTLAAITGNPKNPKAPVDCLDFYTDRIDSLRDQNVDLVCLPEWINACGLAGGAAEWAEPIPGPTSERLAEKARSYGMYVAASIVERQDHGIYNTGLLLDRTGGILGKHRKTQVTLNEGLVDGLAPGNDYPVFRTDFGVVGYMICYDGHYPEIPRILGLQGAEVILFSNMGDGREGGGIWEPVVQTRAIDNQAHIVASLNRGTSCIVSPKGEFLSKGDGEAGSIALATCDLNSSICDFSKLPIHRRYDQLRRADSFSKLTDDLWNSV